MSLIEGKMKQLPKSINITETGITIVWDKVNSFIYPFKYLRLQCSCAGCVEEMTGKKILDVQTVQEDIIAVDFLEVGKYAIQILWSDGHQTGIYPFEFLIRLAENDDAVTRIK